MIERRLKRHLRYLIAEFPAVALLGPRQVGKMTLAHEIAVGMDSIYLDLESAADRAKLSDPELYLADHEQRLVILDEVHKVPDLFHTCAGLLTVAAARAEKRGVSCCWARLRWTCCGNQGKLSRVESRTWS